MTSTALLELETLTKSLKNPEDPELKVALSRIALEVNSRYQAASASSVEYMASVVEVLKKIPGPSYPELRINCLLDISHFFFLMGQTFSAIGPAADAVAVATESDNKPLLRKALTFLGMMYADTGNVSQAIESYAQALDLAQSLRDCEAECSVWVNLGGALYYAAQYRDAISCHEHVIQLAGANPILQKFRLAALSNIALCSLHTEDFARGLKAAEMSVNESPEPHSAAELVSRVLKENYYIRLLLEVNSIEKAGERCAISRRYAARSKSARADIASSIAEGLYEVQAGRVDVGISRLTNTLERARILRAMLRDTLAALVKAYEIVGQPERALIYLREMMESLRQTQQESALKHVKMHLEQLGEDVGGEAPITPRLKRQEAALQGKVAQQELFRSRIEMLERLAV
ncbi:MAG: tetratricopeptide repeat protein, partial [Usitatibacter sp.]